MTSPKRSSSRVRRAHDELTDAELLTQLRREPGKAWPLFLDRYGPQILGWLRHLGFDYDESMDRFVYICEKLAEDRCRRLRGVRRLGSDGELVPWLRQVVRNLVASWAWSVQGRRRLLRSIESLGDLEQEVFRLHYWDGLRASEVYERLRAAGREVQPIEVFEVLETVYSTLTSAGRWRLLSQLGRRRAPLPLNGDGDTSDWEPATEADNPEEVVLRSEERRQLARALDRLDPAERLAVQLRYDEMLDFREIGALLGCDASTARRRVGRALERMSESARVEAAPRLGNGRRRRRA